jgi:hypothetical protein
MDIKQPILKDAPSVQKEHCMLIHTTFTIACVCKTVETNLLHLMCHWMDVPCHRVRGYLSSSAVSPTSYNKIVGLLSISSSICSLILSIIQTTGRGFRFETFICFYDYKFLTSPVLRNNNLITKQNHCAHQHQRNCTFNILIQFKTIYRPLFY